MCSRWRTAYSWAAAVQLGKSTLDNRQPTVCTAHLQQQIDPLSMPVSAGDHQRRRAALVSAVNVRSILNAKASSLQLAVRRSVPAARKAGGLTGVGMQFVASRKRVARQWAGLCDPANVPCKSMYGRPAHTHTHTHRQCILLWAYRAVLPRKFSASTSAPAACIHTEVRNSLQAAAMTCCGIAAQWRAVTGHAQHGIGWQAPLHAKQPRTTHSTAWSSPPAAAPSAVGGHSQPPT